MAFVPFTILIFIESMVGYQFVLAWKLSMECLIRINFIWGELNQVKLYHRLKRIWKPPYNILERILILIHMDMVPRCIGQRRPQNVWLERYIYGIPK